MERFTLIYTTNTFSSCLLSIHFYTILPCKCSIFSYNQIFLVTYFPLGYCAGVRDVPTNSVILLSSRGRVSFPSHWVLAELHDLFLVHRIWQNWWEVTSKIRLEKDWGFHLRCIHSDSHSLYLGSLTLGEASCRDVSSPMERFMQGRNRDLLPMTSEEVNPAKNHMRALGSRFSSPIWAFRWLKLLLTDCNLTGDPEPEPSSQASLIFLILRKSLR